MHKRTKTLRAKLNYLNANKLPFEATKIKAKKKSSFDWSFLNVVVLMILIFISLKEQAWPRMYHMETKNIIGRLPQITYENQLISEKLTDFYEKEAFASINLEELKREYVILPSISKK